MCLFWNDIRLLRRIVNSRPVFIFAKVKIYTFLKSSYFFTYKIIYGADLQ